MLHVQSFTFNPFQENTYVVHNGSDAIIVDPGCYTSEEQNILKTYIDNNGLRPLICINTHAHLDHIFGNGWVHRTYGLKPWLHQDDLFLLEGASNTAQLYGL